ncbi:MAG: hypothetical protein O3B31_13230, partial [Chloroflexi bacterium]|nr:hypothetical protein [Chloroflexota bacterium]
MTPDDRPGFSDPIDPRALAGMTPRMPGLTDPDEASAGATARAGNPAAPDDPPPTPPPTSTPVETVGPAAEPSVP